MAEKSLRELARKLGHESEVYCSYDPTHDDPHHNVECDDATEKFLSFGLKVLDAAKAHQLSKCNQKGRTANGETYWCYDDGPDDLIEELDSLKSQLSPTGAKEKP